MPTSFISDILPRVPREHLSLRDIDDWSPLRYAVANTDKRARTTTIPLLILHGAPVLERDFPEPYGHQRRRGFDAASRQQLRAWAEAELFIRNEIFVALVLGCGVHHARGRARRSQDAVHPIPLLALLRGAMYTEPRQLIAQALGVRTGPQLRRIQEARGVLASLEMGKERASSGVVWWEVPGVGLAYPRGFDR